MRNFFEHQDRAFSKSVKLLLLLAVAVIGTTVCTGLALTYLVLLLLYLVGVWHSEFSWQMAELFLLASILTATLIGISSWWKMRRLRAGGKVIALDLGGQLLQRPETPEEKRVLNVVEEIAVASGIPAPAVYVIEQPSINAFAAGFEFDDAVLGVTRGCISRLSREQLQGVMAHEFSHILNGDMRMNLRLAGALHGIVSIALVAEGLLFSAAEWFEDANGDDAEAQLGAAAAAAFVGLFIWPIGVIGTFFGMLVMSATSRTREFLADAYAVQFTRNPEGIAGALKVLAGHDSGSRVRSKQALEASHFFFARGYSGIALMATHPPVEERIRRLDPHWDGIPHFEDEDDLDAYNGAYENSLSLLAETADATAAACASVAGFASSSPTVQDSPDESSERRLNELFAPNDWTRRHARDVLAELPPEWGEWANDVQGAEAMVTALCLAQLDDPTGPAWQSVDTSMESVVRPLLAHVSPWNAAQQTLLWDLSTATLKQHAPPSVPALLTAVESIRQYAASDHLTLWSWARQIVLLLRPQEGRKPRYGRLGDVQPACEVLVSWFCHAGADSDAMAAYAFQRAVVHLGLVTPEIRPRGDLTIDQLDVAIDMLADTSARCRRQVMIAVGCCIGADQVIEADEASLVRGTCAALNLPVPQLLPGQAVAPGL